MSGRGEYRPIHTVLVDSPEFQDLSKEARLLLFAIKLSLGPAGIGVLYGDQLRVRSGLSRDEFEAARDELRSGEWIRTERMVYWLRNGLKFEPRLSPKNDNHATSVRKHVKGLPKLQIVNDFARYYDEWFDDEVPFPSLNEGHGDGISKASERHRKGPAITETETETSTETETETSTEGVGGLSRLLGYLPDSDGVENSVRTIASTARGAPESWATGFLGLFGPSGTRHRMLRDVDEDERPDVLLDALQAYVAEGQSWDRRFFEAFLRDAVKRHLGGVAPNHGDESHRDRRRRSEYRRRESDRRLEQQDLEDAEAEAEMAELWDWWGDLDPDRQDEIKAEAAERAKGTPQEAHRPILVGVIQEHRTADDGDTNPVTHSSTEQSR